MDITFKTGHVIHDVVKINFGTKGMAYFYQSEDIEYHMGPCYSYEIVEIVSIEKVE